MANTEKYRKMSEDLTGKRIKCLHMNDEYPILSGELGTVDLVDDMGTIHVNWDSGRRLGLVPDEDEYEMVN